MASVALRTEYRKINSCTTQFDGLAVLPQLFLAIDYRVFIAF